MRKVRSVTQSVDPVIGERFGRLTVVGGARNERNVMSWICECDCGEVVRRQPSNLREGKYLNCRRCSGPVFKELGVEVGKKFGHLTVRERGAAPDGATIWHCDCDCGGSVSWPTYQLKQTKTPGCPNCEFERRSESLVVHGDFVGSDRGTKSRLWRIWSSMHERCNGNTVGLENTVYRRKRITVCEEWSDFAVFRDWALANGYAEDKTIERRDSYGHYNPLNCEWISRSENSRRAVKQLAARRRWEAPMKPWDDPHFPIEMFWGGA